MTSFKDYFYLAEEERRILDPIYIKSVNSVYEINITHKNLDKLLDYRHITTEHNFNCGFNNLSTLVGSPSNVGGNFRCHYNPLLKNLIGSPVEVGGTFNCSFNNLISLEGAPEEIMGSFICRRNMKLTSLYGAPRIIGKDFTCSDDPELSILENGPKWVKGNFNCSACFKIKEDQWKHLPIIDGVFITNKDLNRNEHLIIQMLKARGRIGGLFLSGKIEQAEDDNDPFNL